MERAAGVDRGHKLREPRRRAATTPDPPPHPQPNQALPISHPAADIAGGLADESDGPHLRCRVAEDLGPPMREESLPISDRRKGDSPRFGVALVLKKGG